MADEDQNKLPADAQKRSSIPRRSLFGTERSEDTDEWLRDLEKRNLEEKVQKWNFDFREGKPLKQNELSSKQGEEQNLPSPSHVYEAVDANEVPAFYRSKATLATTDMDKVKLSTPPTTPIAKSRKRKLEVEEKAEEEPQQDLAIVLRREKANWLSPSGKEARQQQKEEVRGKSSDQNQGETPKKISKKEEGAKVEEKKNSQEE